MGIGQNKQARPSTKSLDHLESRFPRQRSVFVASLFLKLDQTVRKINKAKWAKILVILAMPNSQFAWQQARRSRAILENNAEMTKRMRSKSNLHPPNGKVLRPFLGAEAGRDREGTAASRLNLHRMHPENAWHEES